jgi:nitrite reductase/ring-hydroxylating ferredoxin subunit
MQQDNLTKLCRVDEVPVGGVHQAAPAGRDNEYAVYRLDGEYFCTDDICTHGLVFLSGGEVEDGQIFCPLHGGAFDIRTGKATAQPCRIPLKTYRVVQLGDELYADLG